MSEGARPRRTRGLRRRAIVALLITLALLVGCAAPEASPSPTLGTAPTDEPTPTIELSPAASPSPAALATPQLSYVGARNYRIDDDRFTAYELALTNLGDYPAQLFVDQAHSPCLLIGDAASNQPLAELCPLTSLVQLAELSFSLPRGQAPPAAVYVELTDRRSGHTVRSGAMAIETVARATPTARPSPTPGADGWIGPERISTRFYDELSLVIDDQGIAHAVALLNDSIFYLTNQSGSWTRERISRAPSGGIDRQPSIAVDGDGSLHVAFERWRIWEPCIDVCVRPERFRNDGIHYLTNVSGSWSVPARIAAMAMAVEIQVRDGQVHLVFQDDFVTADDDNSSVHYSTNASHGWVTERIDAGHTPQLELDNNGLAHATYREGNGIYYARAQAANGSFLIEQVPAAGEPDWPLLALDGRDRPHLVYSAWHQNEQVGRSYLQVRDGGWLAPQVVLADRGEPTQLIVGDRGAIHLLSISFEEVEDEEEDYYEYWDDLWYATDRSGAFEDRHLLRSVVYDFGPWPSMALAVDPAGRPHILFTASIDYNDPTRLWYAIGP
jgi:hypothetical protein